MLQKNFKIYYIVYKRFIQFKNYKKSINICNMNFGCILYFKILLRTKFLIFYKKNIPKHYQIKIKNFLHRKNKKLK